MKQAYRPFFCTFLHFFQKKSGKSLQVSKKCLPLHPRSRKTHKSEQIGAVVQLVRIPACHAGGRGFESRPHRQREHSSVGLEHLPYKQRVGGSTPSAPTRKAIQFLNRFLFVSRSQKIDSGFSKARKRLYSCLCNIFTYGVLDFKAAPQPRKQHRYCRRYRRAVVHQMTPT